MSLLDWIVMAATMACIVLYGMYKSKTSKDLDGYFLSNRTMPWYMILLSIMGTQASAITFLSAPGQAYTDGMRFVQYYFGLPLAMVLLCISFVPIFHRLKVYTAYEYLENRFDVKTRTLTSSLFLLQRGLSTGISIYAPSLILSSLLGWNIYWTNIFMGGLLIIYTVSGGARAVAYTQQLQFIIIFLGMVVTAYMLVHLLPEGIGFFDTLKVSGRLGKLNVITTGTGENGFNWDDRYNIWSGLIGGFFLALSYFGTDQSQVGRYLTAKTLTESRIGLLMNGLVKVPMQFLILLVGALVFTFYQFNEPPIFFNETQVVRVRSTPYRDSLDLLQRRYKELAGEKKLLVHQFVRDYKSGKDSKGASDALLEVNQKTESVRTDFKKILDKDDVRGDSNDTNYIFLRFVVDYMPMGLVGLLIAIIFIASWGSIAAALNSLSSSTVVDIHKKFFNKDCTTEEDYRLSKWYSFGWGIFSIIIAQFAGNMGSLIEAVNVLGSLFYGVILGIFLVAFYLKNIRGNAVFYSAVIVEFIIIISFAWPWITSHWPGVKERLPSFISRFLEGMASVSFLWLNAIGAIGVVVIAGLIHLVKFKKSH